MPPTGYLSSNPSGPDVAFASYSSAWLTVGFGCSGTFTAVCNNGPPYDFTFADLSPIAGTAFSMQPGGSFDFMFGTFTPTGGIAPPGTYEYDGVVVQFLVRGYDADGNNLDTWVRLASTCPNGVTPDCAFTRTVIGQPGTAVPEPANVALLVAGLMGLAVAGRRRLA